MKLRLEGTEAELERAKQFYESLQSQGMVKLVQWSKLYPNRKSPGFRVYIELEILSDRPLEPKMAVTSSGEGE